MSWALWPMAVGMVLPGTLITAVKFMHLPRQIVNFEKRPCPLLNQDFSPKNCSNLVQSMEMQSFRKLRLKSLKSMLIILKGNEKIGKGQ